MHERTSTHGCDKPKKIYKHTIAYLLVRTLWNPTIHFRKHSTYILAHCLEDKTVKLPFSVSSKSHLLKIVNPNALNLWKPKVTPLWLNILRGIKLVLKLYMWLLTDTLKTMYLLCSTCVPPADSYGAKKQFRGFEKCHNS